MSLQRKHYMVDDEHIDKLVAIKQDTGASHSHSVRKAIEGLKGNAHQRRKQRRKSKREKNLKE